MPEDPVPSPVSEQPTLDQATHGSAGSFGRYRLLQRLGEGGMGEVWRAAQTEPVHREIALKVIKAGMDSAQVVARFEAERQALALMDHPAIAKVFDGGTTPQGRPYFAMEYVKGEPITVYCDRHGLSTKERLQLFTQVCEGVQHAHQKGIIHRDLKPSNVLVTIQDDKAAPKIIDFGVAKAISQPLTERSLFTELGVLIGTPEYMSPEQAEMGSLDIDTRTDIYALGVLLYELLTGTLPFDRKELRQAGIAEIQKIIREKEPPRPSTRVSQLGPASIEVATNRRTEPRRLMGDLRGDLDWITMRALEKDRTRRYQTANALAADVRRQLANEPVLARPPSAGYRAYKFVRRHRSGVAAASAVALALVTGLVAASLGWIRAREAERVSTREAATAKAVSDFMVRLFEVADPNEARSRTLTAQEMLARGVKDLDRALAGQPEVQARIMTTLSNIYTNLGRYQDAEPLAVKALETYRRLLGGEHPDTLKAAHTLANLYWYQNRLKDAEALYTEVITFRKRVLGAEARDTLKAQWDLTGLYDLQGRYSEMERLSLETLEAQRRLFGEDDPDTLATMHNLATSYYKQRRYEECVRLNQTVLEATRRSLGPDHPQTLFSMHNLATTYHMMGRYEDAERLYGEVIQLKSRVLGEAHSLTAQSVMWMGSLQVERKRYKEGETLLLSAYATQTAALGERHPRTLEVARRLAELYEAWRKPTKASEWRTRAQAATPSAGR
jgi:tetratricopeptide (TPR) repeat protein